MKVNNPDGTVRFGTYSVNLYKPPVMFGEKNPNLLLKQSVKVTIGQPRLATPPKPPEEPAKP